MSAPQIIPKMPDILAIVLFYGGALGVIITVALILYKIIKYSGRNKIKFDNKKIFSHVNCEVINNENLQSVYVFIKNNSSKTINGAIFKTKSVSEDKGSPNNQKVVNIDRKEFNIPPNDFAKIKLIKYNGKYLYLCHDYFWGDATFQLDKNKIHLIEVSLFLENNLYDYLNGKIKVTNEKLIFEEL